MGQEGGLHKGLKAQWGGPGALVGEGVVRKRVACVEHQPLNQEVEVCAGQGMCGEHTVLAVGSSAVQLLSGFGPPFPSLASLNLSCIPTLIPYP